MKQLRHMDTRHFVILECRHLANGCVLKCGCIDLMLFHNLSCLGTIICYTNIIGIIPAYACNVLNVCDALVASSAMRQKLIVRWLSEIIVTGRTKAPHFA